MKKMLRALPLVALCLIMVCLLARPAQAADWHEGYSSFNKPTYTSGLYTYTLEKNEAIITDVDTSVSGHVLVPSELDGYPVTFLYGMSFAYCNEVTEITVPDSVRTIGFNCFRECKKLTTVNLGANVETFIGQAFYKCPAFTTLNWGPKVTKIGRRNFENCDALVNLTIPDTVTTVGEYLFAYCDNLTSVTLSKNLEDLPQAVFTDCPKLETMVIPDSVQNVGKMCFDGCTALQTVTIGEGVKTIGMDAFLGCKNLTAVSMNNSIEQIGKYAFKYCEKLQSIVIPDTTTIIDEQAFEGCEALQTVTIGKNVESIGTSAFKGCSALESVVIPDSVTVIGNFAFSGCSGMKSLKIGANVEKIDISAFAYCASLEEIVIPDNVTYLGKQAFASCTAAKSATIGKGITQLPERAFYYCTGLETVTIPESVSAIGPEAFTNCSSMKKFIVADNNPNYAADDRGVLFNKDKTLLIQAPGAISGEYVMPATVTAVGDYAFYQCAHLTRIIFADGVKSIGNQCFIRCENLEYVDYGESLENAGSFCFGYCEKLTEVNLPNTFKSISALMYDGCNGLVNVVLPDSVETVGPEAFGYCVNLKTIDLGNGIKQIQRSAFQYCQSLVSFTAGEHLQLIDDKAFYRCDDLKNIYFRGTNAQWCDVEIVNYYPENYNGMVIGANLHFLGEHEHKYSKYVKDNNATCTQDGTETATCEICGATKSRTLEGTALGHTGGTPTCSSPAICTRCEQPYGSADDAKHSGTELIFEQKVGYTHDGFKEYRCDICGGSFLRDIVPAKGLPKPVVKAVTDAVTGRVTLSWIHDGESEYYEVYRATSKSGKYSLIGTTETAFWQDNTASAGKTYYYKVKACVEIYEYNSDLSSAVSAATKCPAPAVTVKNDAKGKPYISWAKVSGAKKYTVYRATSENGKYSKLGTTTKTYYTDSKASAGNTYFYKVVANASKSTYNSGYSNIVSCGVICGTPSVTVKIDTNTGKPSLSWGKVSGAAKYAVYRDGELLATVTGVAYADTTAAIDTQYTYAVQALGKTEDLNGAASKVVSATSGIAKPDVKGSIDAVSGKPVLTWDAIEGAVKYEVYRSTKSNKSYVLIGTVEGCSYTDETVSAGKTYYYQVKAIGQVSKSALSAYDKLTGKCATPQLKGSMVASNGKPFIRWEKVSGAKKYTIYRATSENGKYAKLGTTTKTEYTDAKAVVGMSYYYKIVANASSSKYNSGYSNIVFGGCICATPVVKASVEATTGYPMITWQKVTGAVTYQIYRATNDGYVPYETVKGTKFVDQNVEMGQKYWYVVEAFASGDTARSGWSNESFATATCATPKITGKVGANKKPIITWGEVEGATKYIIYRSTSSSKGFAVIGETEDLSWEDLTAKKGKTYYYKVVAVGDSCQSAMSSYAKVKSK